MFVQQYLEKSVSGNSPGTRLPHLLMTIIASLDPNSEGRLERIQRLEREAGLNRSKLEQGGVIAA